MLLRKDGQPDRRRGRTMPKGEACANFRHGHKADYGSSSEYKTWRSMKARCLNPNDPAYDRYGGRGVVIDPRWVDSFEAFLEDMGPRPAGKSLDRIDNDGPYNKGNCRWATREEQGANQRTNNNLTIDGVTKPLQQWAKEYKVDPGTIRYRMRVFGWDAVKAVTTPKMRERSNRYA